MKRVLGGMLLLLGSSNVFSAGNIDLRLAAGSLEFEDGPDEIEIENSGFQFRGEAGLSEQFFLRANYLDLSSDEVEVNGVDVNVDVDASVLRAGLGGGGVVGSTFMFGALEYGRLDIEVDGESADDSGYVVSFGIRGNTESPFLWSVELGLVKFDDVDGGTFDATLGYQFNQTFALVGGIQSYYLEDDFNAEADLVTATIGARILFQ